MAHEREQCVLLWLLGRLDKCRERGVIGGGHYQLGDAGKPLYEQIEAHGFVPKRHEIHQALRGMEIPAEQHDWLTSLVMPSY